jgi:hypothetical protein
MQQHGVCVICGNQFTRAGSNRARYCYRPCSFTADTLRARAARAVQRAVRAGRIPSPSQLYCVDCGGFAREYDHRDYGRPLAVEPVCRSCNLRRGPALFPAAAA